MASRQVLPYGSLPTGHIVFSLAPQYLKIGRFNTTQIKRYHRYARLLIVINNLARFKNERLPNVSLMIGQLSFALGSLDITGLDGR